MDNIKEVGRQAMKAQAEIDTAFLQAHDYVRADAVTLAVLGEAWKLMRCQQDADTLRHLVASMLPPLALSPPSGEAAKVETPNGSNPCKVCGAFLWADERPCWNCARLKALAPAAPAQALRAGQWQDISTAPKDGVLLIATDNGSVGEAFRDPLVKEWRWTAHEFEEMESEPTHWMPLPPAPSQET